MAKNKGYIILQRSILDNWLWKSNEPFDKRSAWIDLILLANHADSKMLINGELKEIKRGQHHTSIVILSKRWNWSVNKVRRYLKTLESDEMIYIDGTPNGTTLTLVNYGFLQDMRRTYGTTDELTDGTTDGTTDGIQTKKNKRMNKERKEKSVALARVKIDGVWKELPVGTYISPCNEWHGGGRLHEDGTVA